MDNITKTVVAIAYLQDEMGLSKKDAKKQAGEVLIYESAYDAAIAAVADSIPESLEQFFDYNACADYHINSRFWRYFTFNSVDYVITSPV